MKESLGERHLLSMSALAAGLTRVGGIDLYQFSASFFRFARKLAKEFRPRSVGNALCQTMVVYHVVDGQILNTNDAETVNHLPALLMGEVVTSKLDTLMHPRDR